MDASILSLETSIKEKDENSTDGSTDHLMDLSLPPTVIQQNNSNHKDEHEEKNQVLESADQPTACSEEQPLSMTSSSEAVLSSNVAQAISEKIEKNRESHENEEPQVVDLHKKIQETDPSTTKEVVESNQSCEKVNKEPGNGISSFETTDNSSPPQLNVESSAIISENKPTNSSPLPPGGTTTTTTASLEKQLKSEKLEPPPLVPPVVLSLTPRSRSSSHSSKSSKPASPIPIPTPSPRPKQKVKRPPNKDVAAVSK